MYRCRWACLTGITNKEKVENMGRIKVVATAGVFFVLSVLVVSVVAFFKKGKRRRYGSIY